MLGRRVNLQGIDLATLNEAQTTLALTTGHFAGADRLIGDRTRHSWQWWELIVHLDEPGIRTLRARATDLAGRMQPDHAEWNRLGYGNNSVQAVAISIV